MPLADKQVQIRDLIMGPGTPYRMMSDFNPFIRHVRADQGGPRAWNHGSWSGVEWMDEAVVPMRILVSGGDSAGWLPLHQALAAAFAPGGEQSGNIELRFVLGGSEYVMFGRPRMVEPDLTMLGTGRTFTRAAFVAQDPFIYSAEATVAGPTTLPTFTGGLTVPLAPPFTVDAVAASGFLDLTNTGTADTALAIRIDGPIQEPRVTLQHEDGTAQTLRFDFDLEVDQWLDIDTGARTVLLNGTSSRRGQTSGDFPILPPGTHALQFRAGEYNDTAQLTATFRSAWW